MPSGRRASNSKLSQGTDKFRGVGRPIWPIAAGIPQRRTELEKTNFDGTIGHLELYGKTDEFTHGIKSGPGFVTGLVFQWQNEKQVSVWPAKIAEGKLKFPDFVKLSQ